LPIFHRAEIDKFVRLDCLTIETSNVQRPGTKASEIERLYRHHGAALLLFAVAMTRDRDRAQDAVHQVFLKLLEGVTQSQVVDIKAYLFRCVRNAVLNETKVFQRSMSLEDDSAWFNPPERDYSAELNLRRELSILPVDQRETVVLHIWGELTFSQIAEILEISANTAASRYRYALAKLREAMCAKEDSRVRS
jgi:RNA polymerase sigma-70 factor (ECF subfamily)